MTRYVGIVYDDREPEHIMERFVSSIRDEVKEKIDGVFRDFTDPDDGVRPSHLQYAIDEEPAASLLLSKEELQLIIACLNDVNYFEGPTRRIAALLRAECKTKLNKSFK